MKVKINTKSSCYKSEDMEIAHKAIKAKWELLRDDLRLGKFRFDDVCEAQKVNFYQNFTAYLLSMGDKCIFLKH